MDRQQTCKRCSLARVNVLCTLYEEAFREKETKSFDHLQALVKIAQGRGFQDAYKMLLPDLAKTQIRAMAWNVSSFLFNDDLLQLGIPLNGRG